MKPKTQSKPSKLPRARAERFFISRIDGKAYITRNDTVTEIEYHHCALIPCASLKQARLRVRVENMTHEERAKVVSHFIRQWKFNQHLTSFVLADAVLSALGFSGGGQ